MLDKASTSNRWLLLPTVLVPTFITTIPAVCENKLTVHDSLMVQDIHIDSGISFYDARMVRPPHPYHLWVMTRV